MKGYMPQDVFEMAAVTIAKLHFATGKRLDELSSKILSGYKADYLDDGFALDAVEAAKGVIQVLQTSFPGSDDSTLAVSCTQLQYCIKRYRPDGSKRGRRLFGGTLFNNQKQSNPIRVQECLRDITVYSVGTMSGKFPIAPHGWSL